MRLHFICILLLAPLAILPFRASAAEASTSVLVLSDWVSTDFNYLQALHRRGFALDYDDNWIGKLKQGKLADHLQRYNVVVLTYTTSLSVVEQATLTETLAKYAENGGGVLLMPDTVNLSNGEIDSLIESQKKCFGAAVVKGLYIVDENPENQATGGMKSPHYQWTDNVVAHDLTRGVSGIWYNVDTSHGTYRCHT